MNEDNFLQAPSYTLAKTAQEKGFVPTTDIIGDGVYHARAQKPINENRQVELDLDGTQILDKDISQMFNNYNQHEEVLPGVPGMQPVINMFSYQKISRFQHSKKINNLLHGTTAPGLGVEEPIGGDCCDDYTITKFNKQ
ncbi:MAG: hypothetical protein ACOCQQ_01975 [Candidatus Nanoarchaeia archaeon]